MFHCKVAIYQVPFFHFLGGHAHQMRLDMKYFRKFIMFTETLGNNAPLSNCTRLCRCVQGRLNYHLSSTVLVISGINNLDAAERLQNPANGRTLNQQLPGRCCTDLNLRTGLPYFYSIPNGPQERLRPSSQIRPRPNQRRRESTKKLLLGVSTN